METDRGSPAWVQPAHNFSAMPILFVGLARVRILFVVPVWLVELQRVHIPAASTGVLLRSW